ncbi:MAG: amino acid ABC transporter permease [Christensenellales bacterium]|jgi:His/Glu/Gln/Arg/opine family amino acid ABC transporter permease subunit
MELFHSLTHAIYTNLIRESRFLLLLKGFLTTLEITIMALILGILIGIVIASFRIVNVKPLNWVAKIYLNVIRGTPAVVQLVIIYYAILASATLPKVVVASVAFAINSGAYVSELIRGGILAVDKGQMEAARSLGMSWSVSMFRVILPQALKTILPSLMNEAIALLKETAIAGYIALDDITRSGDIIRSRTFDPYTPFILVAVVYLYTTTVMSSLAGRFERRLRESD